ncbi:endoribonuclease L-PSP/chorismate mutase-like protein [Pochonia chlamydosporia 170]|uniref:Endoribonuclease L-PSP/chorismate mutase-like protein n=1 Tax=Pochonia chlamydosporia 170 TaxID=1380566 RepID=A0A179FUT1_METCM|nr:endoribonuclease L-PSP/chorismate mutase-like protein [Pochonia chlamydosporia 170]OAQ68960.2 endoribonuclease L-PSP/chorismate mutase-like protein [Pochonia chlamydosporia 170]
MSDSPNGTPYFRSSNHAQGLANYPHARIVPSGNAHTIYVSGTSSRCGDGTFVGATPTKDESGNTTLDLDIRLQSEAVLSNISEVIKGATDGKANMRNVVEATVFLVNVERDYKGMNEEWNKVWPDRALAPARTTVEVRALPRPEILVEIKCVAHLP